MCLLAPKGQGQSFILRHVALGSSGDRRPICGSIGAAWRDGLTMKSFASLYLVHVGKLQAKKKKHSDHCDLKWSSAKFADPICIRTTTSAWDMITMSFGIITNGTVACRHKTAWATARTPNISSSTILLLNPDLTQDHAHPQHVWIWI